MGRGRDWFARVTEVGGAESAADRALVDERYRALQRQIPLLYTVALTNFIGLHLATGGQLDSLWSPVSLLVAFVLVRLAHWLRTQSRTLAHKAMVRELRRTWCYALLVSGGFSTWALHLLAIGDPAQDSQVALFGSLAAVGCAYGLSSFPAAARLPLLFLGLPIAISLLFSGDAARVGMGLSLGLVILFILRLLGIHNAAFTQLVLSRSDIAAERERARRAEKLAKAEKARAKLMADRDPLTGLANRRAFLRALGRRAGAIARTGGRFALAVIDLDGFKPVNDTFGHATGDALLQQIGGRLSGAAGRAVLVARTGGDEFALLLPRARSAEAARATGARICAALQEPFEVEGREFRISGCCGLAMLQPGDCNVAEALIRADTALYRAKQGGRAGVAVFSPEMDESSRRRVAVEQALRSPEAEAAIGLVYQPVRDLDSGEIVAFEALARWQHPALGPVSPAEFIPIAEQINTIQTLSETLLARAAAEARGWAGSIRLSFNVSAVQLCSAGSARRMLAILDLAALDPSRLQAEVTETALLADFEVGRENLQTLRAAGARIVLDDFGAGHASISYLREMQFDGIKLDGSLIASVASSLQSRRLLKGVLDLCASLGVPCVAEHIESEAQHSLLRELGCRYGQGYLLAPPLSAAEAAELARPVVRSLGKRAAA